MTPLVLLFLAGLVALTTGCSGATSAAKPVVVVNVTRAIDTTKPVVENADYKNWKRFPEGTTVKRKSTTASETGTASTTSVETFTLKSATETELVVERQNSTDRSDGSYKVVNPPESRKYVKQFNLPDGMAAEDFTKPSPKAKLLQDETLTVLGKQYATKVYSWADGTEAGPMKVTVWLSDEMPGRVVKQSMIVENLKTTTIDEVIEVKIP